MTVTSLAIIAWFAATVALYWTAPDRWRPAVVVVSTAAFLLAFAPLSALLLAGLTVATYWMPRLWRRAGAPVAVALCVLALLAAFKLGAAAEFRGSIEAVAIPLGLSYYTFRCIHYLVECYKARLPEHDFFQYVSYLFFLPTIIAGPIHRFPEFLRDDRRRRWNSETFSLGCERIVYGYFMIVVLGNWLVSQKLHGFIAGLDPARDGLIHYLECIELGTNVYFQFAGYSSIAIGLALLLGYRIIENFNHPFMRPNISAFWQSWHISLSSWCRDYVYTPVASSTRSVALGAVATMLAIGLWHEISPRYLAWGLYHGLGIVAWQMFQRAKAGLPPMPRWAHATGTAASTFLTFNFVMLSFAVLKERSLGEAWNAYRAMLLGGWW